MTSPHVTSHNNFKSVLRMHANSLTSKDGCLFDSITPSIDSTVRIQAAKEQISATRNILSVKVACTSMFCDRVFGCWNFLNAINNMKCEAARRQPSWLECMVVLAANIVVRRTLVAN